MRIRTSTILITAFPRNARAIGARCSLARIISSASLITTNYQKRAIIATIEAQYKSVRTFETKLLSDFRLQTYKAYIECALMINGRTTENDR